MKVFKFSLLSLFIFAAACGPSTKIEKTWTDPSFTPATAKAFEKFLVVGLLKDESTRRIAEDKLARATNGKGIQSYTYLKPGDTLSTSAGELSERMKKEGFDGVVVMRLVNMEKSTSYVPGSSYGYGGWHGYYRYAAPMYASPGYYTEDKTYFVETNVYSLESDKLLWSGTTSTLNPSKPDKMIDDVIATLKEQLKKQGLVKG
jgi:hypothetical protein